MNHGRTIVVDSPIGMYMVRFPTSPSNPTNDLANSSSRSRLLHARPLSKGSCTTSQAFGVPEAWIECVKDADKRVENECGGLWKTRASKLPPYMEQRDEARGIRTWKRSCAISSLYCTFARPSLFFSAII